MQTGRCTNKKIKKISVTYIESINYGYELFCHIFIIILKSVVFTHTKIIIIIVTHYH